MNDIDPLARIPCADRSEIDTALADRAQQEAGNRISAVDKRQAGRIAPEEEHSRFVRPLPDVASGIAPFAAEFQSVVAGNEAHQVVNHPGRTSRDVSRIDSVAVAYL